MSPVNYGFLMEMLQTTADLGSVERHPFTGEPRQTHVIDVEPQVSSVHER